MMISPEDPRWSDDEDPNSEGLFSHMTATLYSEARKDIEEVLDKIQESLNKVPVCRSKAPEKLSPWL
jgi:hypothetical protein